MQRILLPQLGNEMEEATLVSWLKNEGERVSKGEPLLEVETDKALMEIEAEAEGVLLRILKAEGETVPVLAVLGLIGEPGENVENALREIQETPASPAPTGSEPVRETAPPPIHQPEAPDRIKASPAARARAARLGIDLVEIGPGSGPGGRILSSDLKGEESSPSRPLRRPMTSMREAIARAMVESKRTIPDFHVKTTLDAENLVSARERAKSRFPCSLNVFIVRACGIALQDFPAFRSRIEGKEILEETESNIGIAVGTEEGIRVPVIASAQSLCLRDIADRSRKLIEAARKGRIEKTARAVFTISNLGMLGVEEFSAIISPPEAAILAVGAVREAPVVFEGAVVPRRVLTLTLTCDHRLIDGILAGRFLMRVKELLEEEMNGEITQSQDLPNPRDRGN